MGKRSYEVKDLTLTQLKDHLNKTFKKKKTGTPFTISDVQQYTDPNRAKLPKYLGGNVIELNTKIKGVKLYSIVKK